MRADFPIYRITNSGYEYYIEFGKDTIREMAQRYLQDGLQNTVDTMHNHQLEDGVFMQEMFIKDVNGGINPVGFENVEDGSLFAKFKVENEDIWNEVKEGTFKGFSIEVFCDVEEVISPEEAEILDLINKIKDKINKK